MAARNSGTRPHASASLEVVREAGLRAGAQHRLPVGRVRERLTQRRGRLVRIWVVARLLEGHVARRVADEQHRCGQRDHRDRCAGHHQHVARGELRGQPAAERGCQRDAAVAGRLVQPKRQPTPFGPDEVDLHHDGHGPRESLVYAQQDVGGHHPLPARRERDHERDGKRQPPADDQEPASPQALREDPGAEVGERLREPESDDEGQHCRARCQPEVGLADQRQGRALKPDHRADESVDPYEQRELRDVLAQPELHTGRAHPDAMSGRPARLAATISACWGGAGGVSFTSASTNASSEVN